MRETDNYQLQLPEPEDQFNISHFNNTTIFLDEKFKEHDDDLEAVNNPEYTKPNELSELTNKENFFTAFGKIAKSVSDYITHKGTITNVHGSTPEAIANKIIERDVNGRAKIADASNIKDIANLKQVQNDIMNKAFIGVKTIAKDNITLFGEQVINGINVLIGELVLVVGETITPDNGVYIVQSGDWTRFENYKTANDINNTVIGITYGRDKGKFYKATVESYVLGETPLLFFESNNSYFGSYDKFKRDEIGVGVPVGVPTIWMGEKPDWAIDFGNGASTQYVWDNYPQLDNDDFKSILTTLSNNGWMEAYNEVGFYVPDLRGIVPIGYGTNAIRTSETTAGGNLGAYIASANKSHNHTVESHTHGWGTYRITGSYTASQLTHKNASVTATGAFRGGDNGTQSGTTDSSGNSKIILFDTNYGGKSGSSGASAPSTTTQGTVAKPPTIGCMWIVRFE